MDTRYKGFQLVTLTKQKHHVDFITVPWGSRIHQPSCDWAFDLYEKSAPPLCAAHQQCPLLTRAACAGVKPPKKLQYPGVGSKHGLSAKVVDKQLNPAGKLASRSPLKVVKCNPLPPIVPYKETNGLSNAVGERKLVERINTVDVY